MSFISLKSKLQTVIEMAKTHKWFQTYFIRNDTYPNHAPTMFQGSAIEYMPLFDTSKKTSFQRMFKLCTKLKVIPKFDTSNVTNFYETFYSCRSLENLSDMDFSNGTNFYNTFCNCQSLKKTGTLNLSKATNVFGMFSDCTALVDVSFVSKTIPLSITIPSGVLTAESVQSIIEGLAAVTTTQTLTLHTDIVAILTSEQLTTINDKNWRVG